jgi:hypothetical protein
MSVAADGRRVLAGLSLLSGQERLLRTAVPVLTVAFLAVVLAAGGVSHAWFGLALVVLSLLAALMPDSSAPLFLVLGLCGLWAVSVPERIGAWLLVAALLLLVLHTAVTLASYGPPGTVLDTALLRRWTSRAGVLAAVTALVWLAARLLAGLALPASVPLFVVALTTLLVWVGYLVLRLDARRED